MKTIAAELVDLNHHDARLIARIAKATHYAIGMAQAAIIRGYLAGA